MNISDIVKEFDNNLKKVKASGHPEPTAMSLATVSKEGRPSSRIVLLKEFSERGFVFYTNYRSRKAQNLAENPYAALTFVWHELKKQVRVEGKVEKVSEAESDEYFATRERKSQIGAWASKQSSEIEHKLDFEKRIAKYTLKFALGKVPRPTFWGGYLLVPDLIELWEARDFRLHDRRVFERSSGDDWKMKKIYP
ncbi:MAG: pyridoxamine 5'-phosphate oxidase [Lentisphaeraceae bacterium]|nr:pyridoxamine 5'-phosphate oxidase [Lentisphaeraceae bacterium]